MADRWLRWFDGTVRDGKMRIAAELSQLPVCSVIGVWASLLEDAATSEPRGTATRGREWHALYLQIAEHEIGTVWNALERVGAVRHTDDGVQIVNWTKRQFETDGKDPTARERKLKWKQRLIENGTARNGTERSGTPETYTETETEKNISRSVAVATRPVQNEKFAEFWKSYPRRQGSNPKHPARKKFEAFVKSGISPDSIIAAARAYAEDEKKLQHIGTPYVAQAVTWLNQQRFEDYQRHVNSAAPPPGLSPEQRAAWVREQMRSERENADQQQSGGGRLVLEGGGPIRSPEFGRH